MTLETLRLAALWSLAPLLLAFADTPLRTWGQRYRVHRWGERLVLFSIELNLLMLWLLTRFVIGHDVALVPPVAASALAAVGVLFMWAGAGLAVWGKLALGHHFTASFAIKQDHALVTTGPYAITRHPIYTGLLVMALGGAFALDSLLTLGFALLLVMPLWFHTAIEEPLLVQHFGDAYRLYQAKVPRLIPGWRPSGPRAAAR